MSEDTQALIVAIQLLADVVDDLCIEVQDDWTRDSLRGKLNKVNDILGRITAPRGGKGETHT